MGMLSTLRPGIRAADLTAAASYPLAPPNPVPLQLASPWAPRGELAAVMFADIFGTDTPLPLSRAQAMAIPAAARVRHVLVGMIASTPLRTYGRTGDAIAPAPWINRTDGPLSPWHRMAWTVDDLLWYGWSCWERTNAADGRTPLAMSRVAPGFWSVEQDTGRVLKDRGDGVHVPMRMDSAVLIPGPHEGLLVFAQDTLRHARDLQTAAGQAARTPAAHLVLQQTGGDPLPLTLPDTNTTDMSVDRLIAQWRAARMGANAGVAYLPQSIEAKELGTFSEHLLTEGRNTAAVDVARVAGLPADLIDATSDASLTYSNSRDNDRRAIDYGASLYMGAIQGALSQDPVCPQGTTQAFDLQQWLQANVPGQDPTLTPTPAAAPGPAAAPPLQEVPAA